MITLRPATALDLEAILTRTRAFNAIEGIAIDEAQLRAAVAKLVADAMLGVVWMIERDAIAIGHAVVTYGYDLEFAGRDSFLTEFFIDAEHRGRGAGSAALALIEDELRRRDVRALHLGVRSDNAALRLYERAGFEVAPRVSMTKKL